MIFRGYFIYHLRSWSFLPSYSEPMVPPMTRDLSSDSIMSVETISLSPNHSYTPHPSYLQLFPAAWKGFGQWPWNQQMQSPPSSAQSDLFLQQYIHLWLHWPLPTVQPLTSLPEMDFRQHIVCVAMQRGGRQKDRGEKLDRKIKMSVRLLNWCRSVRGRCIGVDE